MATDPAHGPEIALFLVKIGSHRIDHQRGNRNEIEI